VHPYSSRAFQRYWECSMKLSGLRDLNMTNKTNYLPLVIDFGSRWNHNHIGKLLGQKMVDEIDYFVPMPWGIFLVKSFAISMFLTCMVSPPWSKLQNVVEPRCLGFMSGLLDLQARCPEWPFAIQWTKKVLKGPDPWGITVGNTVNRKGCWGIGGDWIGLDEDLHPPQLGCNFPQWLSFCLGYGFTPLLLPRLPCT